MRVVFSTDSIKYPLTGIGRYTYELARQLQSSDDISELLFLQGRKISRDLPTVKAESNAASGLKNAVKNNAIASELHRLLVPWLKSLALGPYKNFIYHSPNFFFTATS